MQTNAKLAAISDEDLFAEIRYRGITSKAFCHFCLDSLLNEITELRDKLDVAKMTYLSQVSMYKSLYENEKNKTNIENMFVWLQNNLSNYVKANQGVTYFDDEKFLSDLRKITTLNIIQNQ